MENYYTDEEKYWCTGGNTGTLPSRITPSKLNDLGENGIFTFGSNFHGRHIGGAAKTAVDHFGAVWGIGEGLQGRSYAIPTMEGIENMRPAIERFTSFARQHKEYRFYVTAVACGIAGYKPEEIAPMFYNAAFLHNVYLPLPFWKVILGMAESDAETRAMAGNLVSLLRHMHRYTSGDWNDNTDKAVFEGLDRHQMWYVGVELGVISPNEPEPQIHGLPQELKDKILEALQKLI